MVDQIIAKAWEKMRYLMRGRIQQHHQAQCRSIANEQAPASNELSGTQDPQHVVETEELATRCLIEIGRLEEAQKQILYPRFANDYSFDNIGKIMKRNPRWVRRHYHAAIGEIRSQLQMG